MVKTMIVGAYSVFALACGNDAPPQRCPVKEYNQAWVNSHSVYVGTPDCPAFSETAGAFSQTFAASSFYNYIAGGNAGAFLAVAFFSENNSQVFNSINIAPYDQTNQAMWKVDLNGSTLPALRVTR